MTDFDKYIENLEWLQRQAIMVCTLHNVTLLELRDDSKEQTKTYARMDLTVRAYEHGIGVQMIARFLCRKRDSVNHYLKRTGRMGQLKSVTNGITRPRDSRGDAFDGWDQDALREAWLSSSEFDTDPPKNEGGKPSSWPQIKAILEKHKGGVTSGDLLTLANLTCDPASISGIMANLRRRGLVQSERCHGLSIWRLAEAA